MGRELELEVRKLAELEPADRPSHGDAQGILDGEPFFVEVKQARGGTMSQVRPIRFLPVVAHDGRSWYVIPANRLVLAAARYTRGQHGECPWECIAFKVKLFRSYVTHPEALRRSILAAVREDRASVDLRRSMEILENALRLVTQGARESVANSRRSDVPDFGLFADVGGTDGRDR